MVIAKNSFSSKEDLLSEIDKTIKIFKDGDILSGTVVNVARDEVLVDVDYKTEGVIPLKELSILRRVKAEDIVSVEDVVEALVIQKEDKEGRLILSKKRAQYEKSWDTVAQVKEEDGIIKGKIIEVVPKGVLVDIGLRGFLPISQVGHHPGQELSDLIGEEMDFKILELNKLRNTVVLSHKAAVDETATEARAEFISSLEKGQIRKGKVSSIVPFGAFIDLTGTDGLVHVSEISWRHIEHPSEVLEVGQEVTVEVLGIDEQKKRVSLSIKSTQEDPWQLFARNHAIGQIVPGDIIKFVQFGVFIRVAKDIEGMVHISELSNRHIASADQIASIGEKVFAKIVDIDLNRRRISLSIKQATQLMDMTSEEFDPALYGAATDFDDNGNYVYPEGFDPVKNEWKSGFEDQKAQWEANYVAARETWEAHKAFVAELIVREDKIAPSSEKSTSGTKKSKARKFESQNQSFGEVNSSGTLEGNVELEALKESLED